MEPACQTYRYNDADVPLPCCELDEAEGSEELELVEDGLDDVSDIEEENEERKVQVFTGLGVLKQRVAGWWCPESQSSKAPQPCRAISTSIRQLL